MAMKHKGYIVPPVIAFIVALSMLLYAVPLLASDDSALATGRISGAVWQDNNNNGIREPQEPPVAGFPVHLQRTGKEVVGAMVAVVYTDEDGFFVFDNVEEGQYLVFLEAGEPVVIEVVGVNATATIELPVSVQYNVFLPVLR